jgi:RNA polymerase sigma-70 factor, ECF subfamily
LLNNRLQLVYQINIKPMELKKDNMSEVQEVERKSELATAHHDYNKALNAYAFFKLNDSVLGQDLVQDTFVKTWNYLVKRGKIDGMKSFLYHVLNNLIVDEYRKRKRKTVSLDILLEAGFTPSVDESSRSRDMFDGAKVLLLVGLLPVVYRDVIQMRYVDGLSLREISTITGKSENTVSVCVHRGIRKLRVLYTPNAIDSSKEQQ